MSSQSPKRQQPAKDQQPTKQRYEIEIKSLLGTADKAEALKKKLQHEYPNLQQTEQSSQLNHYFIGGDIIKLAKAVSSFLNSADQKNLQQMVTKGKNFSVRTRQQNHTVLLVVKASIDDTTSSNGISRMEFEAETPQLSLEKLDQLLLNSGFQYQAKWSRQREAYQADKMTVCIDKNAGYGYLAEFETVVDDADQVEQVKTNLRQVMETLNAPELDQARLERMFAFYNLHWPEYYGTDHVFVVE